MVKKRKNFEKCKQKSPWTFNSKESETTKSLKNFLDEKHNTAIEDHLSRFKKGSQITIGSQLSGREVLYPDIMKQYAPVVSRDKLCGLRGDGQDAPGPAWSALQATMSLRSPSDRSRVSISDALVSLIADWWHGPGGFLPQFREQAAIYSERNFETP